MTRITQSRPRRQWRRLAARWVELLWSCPCEYNNIATYRCYACGARPPREVRAFLATVPMPALPDEHNRAGWPLIKPGLAAGAVATGRKAADER